MFVFGVFITVAEGELVEEKEVDAAAFAGVDEEDFPGPKGRRERRERKAGIPVPELELKLLEGVGMFVLILRGWWVLVFGVSVVGVILAEIDWAVEWPDWCYCRRAWSLPSMRIS